MIRRHPPTRAISKCTRQMRKPSGSMRVRISSVDMAEDRERGPDRHSPAPKGELIALAIAVTVRCGGGRQREEIAEALGPAAAVNTGAALVYSTRVLHAIAANTSASQHHPIALWSDQLHETERVR
jgi:hypothetical protein